MFETLRESLERFSENNLRSSSKLWLFFLFTWVHITNIISLTKTLHHLFAIFDPSKSSIVIWLMIPKSVLNFQHDLVKASDDELSFPFNLHESSENYSYAVSHSSNYFYHLFILLAKFPVEQVNFREIIEYLSFFCRLSYFSCAYVYSAARWQVLHSSRKRKPRLRVNYMCLLVLSKFSLLIQRLVWFCTNLVTMMAQKMVSHIGSEMIHHLIHKIHCFHFIGHFQAAWEGYAWRCYCQNP